MKHINPSNFALNQSKTLKYVLRLRIGIICLYTADNLSNAKPAVQQRHPGDSFPVSQRGSAKGRQSVPVPILMMDIYLYRK